MAFIYICMDLCHISNRRPGLRFSPPATVASITALGSLFLGFRATTPALETTHFRWSHVSEIDVDETRKSCNQNAFRITLVARFVNIAFTMMAENSV